MPTVFFYKFCKIVRKPFTAILDSCRCRCPGSCPDCTKSLARWLALRTIRSPLFLKNKSSSFFVYVILLSYHTQTITHKRTAMLMLSCFFILNNYISDFFIRPPPFRCLFLLFLLQTSFILGGSLWTNILILTER